MRWILLLAVGMGLGDAAEVTLDTLSGTLHGTLELPTGSGPFPLVILHSGSGPTDRDGNTRMLPGKNDSLRLLAEALSHRFIASLRYDKRGIAASTNAGPREQNLRFETYVADLDDWARQMRKDPRFAKIILAGHSEGALIATLAAAQFPADGLVSMAGPSGSAGKLLREQLRPKLPPAMMADAERVIKKLESGQTVEDFPPALAALFRPAVQPYLISWMRYDPSAALAKRKMPVLIVQGTTDIQVPAQEARLLTAAQPKAALAIIDGMNHVLKLVPADREKQIASYGDPSLPVAPRLVEELISFIRRVAP